MAVQVSGTQVISNSRQLTNIASVDSTTAASITSGGVGGSASSLYSSSSAPGSPSTGDLYWDSSAKKLFIRDKNGDWGSGAAFA